MDLVGLRLHPLQGNLAGFHAVMVSGNWRLIFRFNAAGSAIDGLPLEYNNKLFSKCLLLCFFQGDKNGYAKSSPSG
jgi:proteic killer suppression protein